MALAWRHMDTIIEGQLYLGDMQSAFSPLSHERRKITHALSVCLEPVPFDSVSGRTGIVHKRIGVQNVDYADILIRLREACDFIHQAICSNGCVLVHGMEGQSRSATVVAAYLMYSRRYDSTQAMAFIRNCRPQIWIIPGFQEQLVIFGLCNYAPSPTNGYYVSWRGKIERYIREGRVPPQ